MLHWSPPPVLKMPLADVSCRLAQLFISAGANPDALSKEGQTPIMVAIMQVCLFNLRRLTIVLGLGSSWANHACQSRDF